MYFEAILKKKPNNHEILQSYFENMLMTGDISGLQKASMALSKLGARDYKLWATACLYLAVKQASSSISAIEQKLFPKLAAGLVKSLEPLRSAQEGYLKALVLQINQDDDGKQLLEFLKSKQVEEWGLLDLNIMLMETLDKYQDWEGLKTHCIKILKDLNRDDFNHWKSLIKACIKTDQVQFAEKFIREYKKGQNSMLAMVCLAAEVDIDGLSLNKAAEQYFDFMGSKRSAFNDLQAYTLIEKFDKEEWLKYLDSIVPSSKDQNLFVNIEKFKYYMRKDKYDSDEFVTRQVALYNNSKEELKKKDPKDYHSADDHILLAAYAILEKGNGDKESLLKAVALLEGVCVQDQHQFYVRLWLVRIYLLLGALTKAFAHFNILRVQRLQVESMSHYILTRCATLFPTEDPMKASLDSYSTFKQEFKMGITLVFNRGTYTQLESFMNLRHSVENSLSRGILSVELSQLSQFQTVLKKDNNFSALDVQHFADNRDFDIMFDLPKHGQQQKLSHTLTLGPKVGSNWVKAHELKHQIATNLFSDNNKLTLLTESLRKILKDEQTQQELTKEEEWSCRVTLSLGECALHKDVEQGYTDVFNAFESVLKLRDDKANKDGASSKALPRDWKTLHQFFIMLGTWNTVSNYTHNLKMKRNQFPHHHLGAQKLTDKALAIMDREVKTKAGQMKDCRATDSKQDIEALEAWVKKVGWASPGIIENVIDSLYSAQDQALSFLRTKI